MTQKHILLTNDDGIGSPGLWAAAEALSTLGFVHVVAPRDQFTGAGRSLPADTDGVITEERLLVNGKSWKVYAVGGSPAQAVLHALHEILPTKPDLVVAGINFGENVGSGITISGTVGAALEAAAHGIPALAVSLETDFHHHRSHSTEVDFSTAAYFTQYFAERMLRAALPFDVDVLKVDVPCDATYETPWQITRQSRLSYYVGKAQERAALDEPRPVGYMYNPAAKNEPAGTDVHAMAIARVVSATPLSLDLTSRIDMDDLDARLRAAGSQD
jgi:5'-nucleotidase